MGKIVLLDDSTINKIAAGEVIERPASVVKEIMENSIDAGATSIIVEIRNGGISYIRVTDNGKGIMKDDMDLAFERHATSKLRTADDLDEIKSMGFRGEALASIAAISRVSLISKTQDSLNGYEIVVEGGKIINKEEAGCPNGTSITIENLFFNTPVRYKFLKKDFTESGYIEDAVTRIALIHPEIAIKLINTGKTVIQTSGNGDIRAVIYNIYGKEIAENLINIDYTYDDINIKGVIGKPVISRSNRSNQLFFVNNRHIKDKTLSSAAEQAFKGFVTIGKHGFLVLNLEMNPRKVDVNVHPAKLEVRFQEEQQVFKAVFHAIKEGLSKEDLVANTSTIENIDKKSITNTSFSSINNNYRQNETRFRDIISTNNENKQNIEIKEVADEEKNTEEAFEQVMAKLQKMQNMMKIADVKEPKQEENEQEKQEKEVEVKDEDKDDKSENTSEFTLNLNNENKEEIVEKETIAEEIVEKNKIEETAENKENSKIDENQIDEITQKIQKLKEEIQKEIPKIQYKKDDEQFIEMYEKTFGITTKKQEDEELAPNFAQEFKPITDENKITVFEENQEYVKTPAYKFIGIAFNTYILIEMKNDLYILDQHAAHERIMYEKIKENYYTSGTKDSQLMLLPDIITLTHKEMDIYRDNRDLFENAGFMVEEFGENTVKLSGVPEILIDLETKELFLETLDEINTVARTAKQEIEEKFIATVACKAAVKAHMVLGKEEVIHLLDRLLMLPNPFTCPHGRPTAIKMSKNDIEKKFSRR